MKTKELSKLSLEYKKKGLVVSALHDRVFKTLLSDPSCRDFLIDLIHNVTGIPVEDMKENLRIENPEHPISHALEKGKTSDMIVSFGDHIINLEMNKSYYEGLFYKNTSYATSIQNQLMLSGMEYVEQVKTILINFDNFEKFGDNIITHFMFRDDSGKYTLMENLESYNINLVKVRKMYYNNNDKLTRFERELLILSTDNLEDLGKIVGDDIVMNNAKIKLENLTEDGVFIGLYDIEKRRELEEKMKINYARKQGEEAGEKRGLAKGKKQATIETKLETAKNLKKLGADIKMISEATGLSIGEIEKL